MAQTQNKDVVGTELIGSEMTVSELSVAMRYLMAQLGDGHDKMQVDMNRMIMEALEALSGNRRHLIDQLVEADKLMEENSKLISQLKMENQSLNQILNESKVLKSTIKQAVTNNNIEIGSSMLDDDPKEDVKLKCWKKINSVILPLDSMVSHTVVQQLHLLDNQISNKFQLINQVRNTFENYSSKCKQQHDEDQKKINKLQNRLKKRDKRLSTTKSQLDTALKKIQETDEVIKKKLVSIELSILNLLTKTIKSLNQSKDGDNDDYDDRDESDYDDRDDNDYDDRDDNDYDDRDDNDYDDRNYNDDDRNYNDDDRNYNDDDRDYDDDYDNRDDNDYDDRDYNDYDDGGCDRGFDNGYDEYYKLCG